MGVEPSMSRDITIQSFKDEYKTLSQIEVENISGEGSDTYGTWQGLDADDFVLDFYDLREKLSAIVESYPLDQLTYGILSELASQTRNVIDHATQLLNERNKHAFDQAYGYIEILKGSIIQWNLLQFSPTYDDIKSRHRELKEQISVLDGANERARALLHTIEGLIEPSVASALSRSFDQRRATIANFKRLWLAIVAAAGLASVTITYLVVEQIVRVVPVRLSANDDMGSLLVVLLLRVFALLPIFAVFLLTYRQFSTERGLEEDYAHKAAVATALPNYAGIAVDDSVKDELLSKAGEVIFSSPARTKQTNVSRTELKLTEFRQLAESLKGLTKAE